jgi:uncharacterized protein YlxW (UPF0749 family)
VAVDGIITFGVEAQPIIDALPHAEQARLYQAAAEAVSTEVGTDLAGLVIHRDEAARAKAEAERQKAQQAEQRRAAAQAKADEADDKVEKLERRIATYERRARNHRDGAR